jgi:ornithine cyclodeaminase
MIPAGIRYLCGREVRLACADLDSVAVISEVFRLHSSGQTVLPDEAYLPWRNALGEHARSLNMPGYVGGSLQAVGSKIINGNIANPGRGLPRASGLTLLFDEVSARPLCIMEGAFLSSLRTASVTLLATELLACRDLRDVALIGAGAQAQAHLELLLQRREHFPELRHVHLFDVNPAYTSALRERVAARAQEADVELHIVGSAEAAIRLSRLVIPVTTTTEGYIPLDWLQPGTLLVNVSLDDPLPEVALGADRVIVDDWHLVSADERRLLGRMYRAGQILSPDAPAEQQDAQHRRVDAELGELVSGQKALRLHDKEIILVNPFGLAIEDVALAAHVYQIANERDLGLLLEV